MEAENRRLRAQLRLFTEMAVQNEAILRNFQSIELDLLTADSLPELLRRLALGMIDAHKLEEVSLVLLDPEHELRHLLEHAGVTVAELGRILLVDDLLAVNPLYGKLREPWLGPYLGSHHGPLFEGRERLESVAILPLFRSGALIGSLNFGSSDPTRYTRHHATDFLHRLPLIAGVCLENAINRERLILSGLTDILTGWHNRRYLERRLPEELARARRYGEPLAALMLDVDHFKRVNDGHGHAVGDEVLREVAERVKSVLRGSDVAVRYGGEEFVVVLPQTARSDALRLAERIRAAVAHAPVALAAGGLRVTVSIGVAEVRPGRGTHELEEPGECLLREADEALYRAKAEGRDRVVSCAHGVEA